MSETTLDQSELSWSAHPLRERPKRALAGFVIIVALAALAAIEMGHAAWGGFAAALLVAFLNEFFFPSRFAIDADGVTARYPLRQQRLAWDQVRRVDVGARGGFLGTRGKAGAYDRRGVHLWFAASPDVRERIIARLRDAARTVGERTS